MTLMIVALICVATSTVSASEVTGTLTTASNSDIQTSGSIAGTVSTLQASGGGGSGGNGPIVPQDQPYVAVGGSGENVQFTYVQATAPDPVYAPQITYTPQAAVAPRSQRLSVAPRVIVTSVTTEEVAPETTLAQFDEVPDASSPLVLGAQTKSATAYESLMAGDLTTWFWLVLALVVLGTAGGYIYSRNDGLETPSQYS